VHRKHPTIGASVSEGKVEAVHVDGRAAQVELTAKIQWKPKGASSWMGGNAIFMQRTSLWNKTLRSRFGASGKMATSSARRRSNGERVGAVVTPQPLLGRERLRRVWRRRERTGVKR
jgi:hypothetical protein